MVLTIEELCKPRTYDELVAWMDAVNEALWATPETRALARLARGPAKIYREEVMPFRVLADHVFAGTGVKIRFPADSGNCDVIVEGYDGRDGV